MIKYMLTLFLVLYPPLKESTSHQGIIQVQDLNEVDLKEIVRSAMDKDYLAKRAEEEAEWERDIQWVSEKEQTDIVFEEEKALPSK